MKADNGLEWTHSPPRPDRSWFGIPGHSSRAYPHQITDPAGQTSAYAGTSYMGVLQTKIQMRSVLSYHSLKDTNRKVLRGMNHDGNKIMA